MEARILDQKLTHYPILLMHSLFHLHITSEEKCRDQFILTKCIDVKAVHKVLSLDLWNYFISQILVDRSPWNPGLTN